MLSCYPTDTCQFSNTERHKPDTERQQPGCQHVITDSEHFLNHPLASTCSHKKRIGQQSMMVGMTPDACSLPYITIHTKAQSPTHSTGKQTLMIHARLRTHAMMAPVHEHAVAALSRRRPGMREQTIRNCSSSSRSHNSTYMSSHNYKLPPGSSC